MRAGPRGYLVDCAGHLGVFLPQHLAESQGAGGSNRQEAGAGHQQLLAGAACGAEAEVEDAHMQTLGLPASLKSGVTCDESVGGVSVVSHQREEGLPGDEGAEEERLHHLPGESRAQIRDERLTQRDVNGVDPPSGGPSGTGCVGVPPATS